MPTLTPEQQIRNVLSSLQKSVALPRQKQPTEYIRSTVTQLADLIELYFAGELKAIETDPEIPF